MMSLIETTFDKGQLASVITASVKAAVQSGAIDCNKECSVEGLLAITIDHESVFLVKINELIGKESKTREPLRKKVRRARNGKNEENIIKLPNGHLSYEATGSTKDLFGMSKIYSSLYSYSDHHFVDDNVSRDNQDVQPGDAYSIAACNPYPGALPPVRVPLGSNEIGLPSYNGHLQQSNKHVPVLVPSSQPELLLSDKNDNSFETPCFNQLERQTIEDAFPNSLNKRSSSPDPKRSEDLPRMQPKTCNLKEPQSVLNLSRTQPHVDKDQSQVATETDHKHKYHQVEAILEKRSRRKSKVPMKVTADAEWLPDDPSEATVGTSDAGVKEVNIDTVHHTVNSHEEEPQPAIRQAEAPQPAIIQAEAPQLAIPEAVFQAKVVTPPTQVRRTRKPRGKSRIHDVRSFTSSTSLVENFPFQSSFSGNVKPKLFCDPCKKQFKSKEGWKIHMERHAGHSRYQCPYCDRGFMAQTHLKAHISEHTQKFAFVCQECGKGFKYLFSKKKHMKERHDEREVN